jgi:glyoxylase-like metal-dependent hydrolase (beta-lactamase superfamily II)
MNPYIVQLELGPMQNFVYLIGSPTTRRAVVVDPAWEVERVLQRAAADGIEIVGGLVSHTHPDHVNAADRLDRPLHVHQSEADRLARAGVEVVRRTAGDVLELGPDCRITFVHTPGHTPGSQCFLVGDALVSGDTLFIGGCGRCDLPGGDPEQMYRTLYGTLLGMPDGTRLYPGHNYADHPVSTLGDEKRANPYLQFQDLAAFVAYRMRPRR